MKVTRKIIEIDEEKCDGCGQCILACAEGALELVDGKARLVGEVYCDGLGACIGECPQGALTIIEREAEEFDEAEVERLLKEGGAAPERNEAPQAARSEGVMPCGCPSSATMTLETAQDAMAGDMPSQLGHWPIKLQLLTPQAPFLKNADLVLLADCAAAAYPNLHRDVLRGRVIAMGCPKFDNLDAHIEKLAQVLRAAQPKSFTVLYMEVPCCKGFVYAAEKAVEKAGVSIPVKTMMLGRAGRIMKEETREYAANR